MNFSAMFSNHPFWGILMLAVLAWYSTITVYVAVRGAVDIKHMLRNLKANHGAAQVAASPPKPE
jgi:hypothetical protein